MLYCSTSANSSAEEQIERLDACKQLVDDIEVQQAKVGDEAVVDDLIS